MRGFQPTAIYSPASATVRSIGVTSNLMQRIQRHRDGALPGFTREYGVQSLVWFEQHATMEQAILREKRIKKWNHVWKIELIERDNLAWRNLAVDFGFPPLEPTGFPRSRE